MQNKEKTDTEKEKEKLIYYDLLRGFMIVVTNNSFIVSKQHSLEPTQ